MNFKRLLLFLVAPLMLVMTGCEEQGPDYSLPSIAVTDAAGKDVTTVSFPAEGGVQKFTIAATRSWNIAYTSDWFGINPQSDTNEAKAAKVVEVTITAGENDGEARNETITLTMDKTEKKILISQSGKGQVELGEVLYYENFDKDGQQAQKVNDKWSTYLDSEAGQAFLNPTPESQANVTYAGKSVSVRSNSSNGSAGSHSNCADVASGLNYIWFGTAPTYMTVSGISLAELEGNALTLSFTTERYEYEAEDNTYKNDEFKVYISADGAKWSEVSYTFLSGANLNGKWNLATAQFNLKEVPETLSLYFTANVGSAYAIDDIKLTAGGGGAEIDLAQGGEISAGGNQGGGGFTPSGDYIYFDNFDKIVAAEGSNGWPLMSAEYGNPMPESQTGVTYNSQGVTARNNSNSDGKYSDIAEASGLNNAFFGKENHLTISGISLAELTGNALTVTFAGDKYQKDGDSNFSTEEFKVYISGDGEKWTLLPYTFAGTTEGRWNTATAQFTLKEVPATLSFYFTATVASVYRLDDLMIVAGGTGAEIDLSQGTTIDNAGGGNQGGDEPEQPGDVVKATVAEFLAAAEDATVYELTGTIKGTYNTSFGNFYLEDATGEVLIYGIYKDGEKCYTSLGLKDGDTVTVQGARTSYNGTAQMKNAEYISHIAGEGGETPEPEEPAVPGAYTSDAAFVCSTDDIPTASYTLNGTKIAGEAVSGMKLGTGKLTGVFTSQAVGVEGTKELSFYAVAWKGKTATLYIRVDGGEATSFTLASHDGATGNPPFTALTARESDHYTVTLNNLTASSVVEFSTDASFSAESNTTSGRAVVFGIKLGEGSGEGGGTTPEPEEPETPAGAVKATVAEFLAAAEDATVYELTGEITGTYNTEFGNFYLKDATGEVLIYGILKNGEKCYTSLGLKDGDTVTVQGARASYNGKAQMKNAEYISHTAGQGGTTPEPEEPEEPEQPEQPAETIVATIAEFIAADESTTQWYELTGKITSIEKADYGNIYIQDETTSVLIYGLCATKVEKNDQSFASLGLKVGDTVTLHTLRTSYNGTAQGGGTPPAYYISHEEGVVVEPEVPEGSVMATAVFAEMGFSNEQSVDGKTIAIDENVSIVFKKGGANNAPAYYANGMAIRMYQNGSTLDVTANGKTITSIELTFASNMYYIGADSGELSAEGAVRTWTGSASAVKFTSTGTDKSHRAYVAGIKVTYTE